MEHAAVVSQQDMMNILDACYEKSLNGIPHISASVKEFAQEYLEKYSSPEKAAKAMIQNQIIKCTTSGFITGFGGVITLPVAIPANVGSVLYVQMRMIACTAFMAGLELDSDETQTFVYACLAGVAVNELMKQAGIKFGVKLATSMIKKIPGKVLTKINQQVGFRCITKFGTKGIVNLGKMVPGVGAVVGGSFDFIETRIIGNRAYAWFFEDNFEASDNNNPLISEEELERISENDEPVSAPPKQTLQNMKESVAKGFQNVGAGMAGVFSKRSDI